MVSREGWTGTENAGFTFFRAGLIVWVVGFVTRKGHKKYQARVFLNGQWQDAGRPSGTLDGAQKIVEAHFITRTEVIP